MPTITMKQDNLNERNLEFVQAPLRTPVFLNSVPKSGTHLIRNIMRMFVPVEQQYHATFIQIPNLRGHAMKAFHPASPMLSWGHLLFSDESVMATRTARRILLVRDPYTWVLARARFFVSENFEAGLEHLKGPQISPEALLNMMIFGIHTKAPPMLDIYQFNAAAWIGTGTVVYQYEEIVRQLKSIDSPEAEAFFAKLLDDCGIEKPADWKQRVLIGSDRKQSATARENLSVDDDRIPAVLPDIQKRLVDVAMPGMRALLGYRD
ncbi:hypothetical protein [Hyphomonas sp.]|uniref:hypothetical protein n=1 Tax=Hyphomonas sp. TaxID=87 RepID=UPI0025C14C29|nr:hypothetical protein [Hyphomonas sp.]